MRLLVYSDSMHSNYSIFSKPSSVDYAIFIKIGNGSSIEFLKRAGYYVCEVQSFPYIDLYVIGQSFELKYNVHITELVYMAYIEPGTTFIPSNVPSYCKRSIAIVGDTHHLPNSISFLRQLALCGYFTEYHFYCTPHHGVFIADLCPNLFFYRPDPNYLLNPGDYKTWFLSDELTVATYGNLDSRYHPRRRSLCNHLSNLSTSLAFNYTHYQSQPYLSWLQTLHMTSISVIQPMCGQFTPQILAALSTATVPLIEKVSSLPFGLLGYSEGEDFLFYSSYESLKSSLLYLYSRPDIAKKIALSGLKKSIAFYMGSLCDSKVGILNASGSISQSLRLSFPEDYINAAVDNTELYESLQFHAKHGRVLDLRGADALLRELVIDHFPFVYSTEH